VFRQGDRRVHLFSVRGIGRRLRQGLSTCYRCGRKILFGCLNHQLWHRTFRRKSMSYGPILFGTIALLFGATGALAQALPPRQPPSSGPLAGAAPPRTPPENLEAPPLRPPVHPVGAAPPRRPPSPPNADR
jgi:hypothetical protein